MVHSAGVWVYVLRPKRNSPLLLLSYHTTKEITRKACDWAKFYGKHKVCLAPSVGLSHQISRPSDYKIDGTVATNKNAALP